MLASWIRRNSKRVPVSALRRVGNLYGPFLGAGIHITRLSQDFRQMRVELPLRWYNKNYVGTHFGGSIYAMTDPFYMMMLIQNLGSKYIVWDKAAQIDFIKPGTRRLIVEFEWSEEEIAWIINQTRNGEKLLTEKLVEIRDDLGILVATVRKTLYVRKKDLVSPSV